MFVKYSLYIILIAILSGGVRSEEVNIEGTVRNRFNRPIAGATIKLAADTLIRTETDSGGRFKLSGQITSIKRVMSNEAVPSVTIRGRFIRVVPGRPSTVTIASYDIAGRKLFESSIFLPEAVPAVLSFPNGKESPGFKIITVEFDGFRGVFYNIIDKRGILTRQDPSMPHVAVVKKAGLLSASPIDTLLVSAKGYLPAKVPILSYSQSGIEIILEQPSRLISITRSCDGISITSVSGGQRGWGSRYWDCCKPHCSSPQNTKHLVANCDINGIDEIPCFKEVGNEWSTWLESTKSGCEQDGIAYACYRHVPFAICEKLAYGFAAVPAAGNDACGKCFQLDFDGGAHNNDVKAAHKMMKGKTMIVMASNIGHDVIGGQFDLMIPGGGLGSFREGCRKQWNVDVNDENIVGKGLGGFISKCQERLGWDAAPESLKTCVRLMCDNLFGKDAALHDLWEGCIWYVEWMHAVDNPTFNYKEVPCPPELVELYYSSLHPKPNK